MTLHITQKGKGAIELPDSTVTEKFGIVGASGYGKTHLATVLIEEMLEQRLPIAVIDPEGVFWGLGSSIDGKSPGYKVVVLGGSHGNLDLKPTSGTAMAELVVRTRQPMIFDLSNFDDEDDEALFVAAFAQTLYQRNGVDRRPIHLYCDEIDKFAPEQPMSKAQIASTKALKNIFQRGRGRGIGSTAISQRPAVIKKDILYQVRCLVTFNLPGPLDQDAISRWMIKPANIEKKEREHFLSTLPKLQRGHAWLWSPAWLDVMQQITVRERRTFDASKTPEVGENMRTPVRQEIDLDSIRDIMAELVDRNEQDDPTTLRARVRELETALEAAKLAQPAAAPSVSAHDISAVRSVSNRITEHTAELLELRERFERGATYVRDLVPSMTNLHTDLEAVIRSLTAPSGKPAAKVHYLNEAHELPRTTKAAARRERALARRSVDAEAPAKKAGKEPAERTVPAELQAFRKGERALLIALYDFGGRLSRRQLGTMVGIKPKGNTLGTYLSTVRKAELLCTDGDDEMLTDKGQSVLAAALGRRPSARGTAQILEIWKTKLRAGERAMLEEVVRAGAGGISHAKLAELADIDPDGSTIGTYLSTLRSNALIVETNKTYYPGDALAVARAPRKKRAS